MTLQELIDIASASGLPLDKIEIFVDHDDTQQFGYEPDVEVWRVPDDADRVWITLAPGNAYVVLPDDDDD